MPKHQSKISISAALVTSAFALVGYGLLAPASFAQTTASNSAMTNPAISGEYNVRTFGARAAMAKLSIPPPSTKRWRRLRRRAAERCACQRELTRVYRSISKAISVCTSTRAPCFWPRSAPKHNAKTRPNLTPRPNFRISDIATGRTVFYGTKTWTTSSGNSRKSSV